MNRCVAGLFVVVFICSGAMARQEKETGIANEAGSESFVVPGADGVVKVPDPKRKKTRVFLMKDLLKDIGQEDRAGFIGSFMLKDGRLVTLNAKSLKKHMDKSRLTGILNDLGPSREAIAQAKKRRTAGPARVVTLSELFKDVPPRARNHFFDNMMLKDGGVACVDATELKKAVDKRRLIQILNSLAPAGGARPALYAKVLCGDGWCEESMCSVVSGKWRCRFNEGRDTMCYDWCEDLL